MEYLDFMVLWGHIPSEPMPRRTCLGSSRNAPLSISSTTLWARESTTNHMVPSVDRLFACQVCSSASSPHLYIWRRHGIKGNHLTTFTGTVCPTVSKRYRFALQVGHLVLFLYLLMNRIQSFGQAWIAL